MDLTAENAESAETKPPDEINHREHGDLSFGSDYAVAAEGLAGLKAVPWPEAMDFFTSIAVRR